MLDFFSQLRNETKVLKETTTTTVLAKTVLAKNRSQGEWGWIPGQRESVCVCVCECVHKCLCKRGREKECVK